MYYYQMKQNPSVGDPLAGKWVCCGMVRDYGTPEEIAQSIRFYTNLFSQFDTRYGHFYSQQPVEEGKYPRPDGEFKVIIVKESHGNVAGRDGRDIQESDIVKELGQA